MEDILARLRRVERGERGLAESAEPTLRDRRIDEIFGIGALRRRLTAWREGRVQARTLEAERRKHLNAIWMRAQRVGRTRRPTPAHIAEAAVAYGVHPVVAKAAVDSFVRLNRGNTAVLTTGSTGGSFLRHLGRAFELVGGPANATRANFPKVASLFPYRSLVAMLTGDQRAMLQALERAAQQHGTDVDSVLSAATGTETEQQQGQRTEPQGPQATGEAGEGTGVELSDEEKAALIGVARSAMAAQAGGFEPDEE